MYFSFSSAVWLFKFHVVFEFWVVLFQNTSYISMIEDESLIFDGLRIVLFHWVVLVHKRKVSKIPL